MGKTRIEDSPFNKLIGQWETEGRRLENPETEIKGKDIYSPILDGFFILHKADVEIGKEKVKPTRSSDLTNPVIRLRCSITTIVVLRE